MDYDYYSDPYQSSQDDNVTRDEKEREEDYTNNYTSDDEPSVPEEDDNYESDYSLNSSENDNAPQLTEMSLQPLSEQQPTFTAGHCTFKIVNLSHL